MYDLSELKTNSQGDKEFELELIETFLSEAPVFLTAMKFRIDQGDYTEIGIIAHKFKSTAGIFGMKGLYDVLGKIENECKVDRRPAILSGHYSEMKKTLNQLMEHLKVEKEAILNLPGAQKNV